MLGQVRDALRSDWRQRLQQDEWFLADLREKVVVQLTPQEAFAALDEATALLLAQDDPFLRSECGELMISLARVSDTTALPPRLEAGWPDVIAALAHAPSVAGQLAGWYRRRGA